MAPIRYLKHKIALLKFALELSFVPFFFHFSIIQVFPGTLINRCMRDCFGSKSFHHYTVSNLNPLSFCEHLNIKCVCLSLYIHAFTWALNKTNTFGKRFASVWCLWSWIYNLARIMCYLHCSCRMCLTLVSACGYSADLLREMGLCLTNKH